MTGFSFDSNASYPLFRGHANSSELDSDLIYKQVLTILSLKGGAQQVLPVTNQLVKSIRRSCGLAEHPGMYYLTKFIQADLTYQLEKALFSISRLR